ncbi:MAG TPA: 2-phosphosulfolactate phosphatase [Terriglobia bacterium]|nr:2-phosphosulfolactate phosphatase [Terriglobia bacterium]
MAPADGKVVVIDCFPESVESHQDEDAIIAVDVIRATTVVVTAVARGRKCFPVPTLEAAVALAGELSNPLLVGELGGNMPFGFHLNNSPAEIDLRTDIDRPMVLLSTSGSRLICAGNQSQSMYVACLRNWKAAAGQLRNRHRKIAVIGAGARGEFREEDELCCAWIAEELVGLGFEAQDKKTADIISKWSGAPLEEITRGASADYLRRTDQTRDLDFIVTHVNDLDRVYRFERGGVIEE